MRRPNLALRQIWRGSTCGGERLDGGAHQLVQREYLPQQLGVLPHLRACPRQRSSVSTADKSTREQRMMP